MSAENVRKICKGCGREKNRFSDFERWDALCHPCRAQAEHYSEVYRALHFEERKLIRLRNEREMSVREIGRIMLRSNRTVKWVVEKIAELRDKGIPMTNLDDEVVPPMGKEDLVTTIKKSRRRRRDELD